MTVPVLSLDFVFYPLSYCSSPPPDLPGTLLHHTPVPILHSPVGVLLDLLPSVLLLYRSRCRDAPLVQIAQVPWSPGPFYV